MKKYSPLCLLVLLLSLPALAQTGSKQVSEQDRDSLPNTFLRGKKMIEFHPAPGGRHGAEKMAAAARSTPNAKSTKTSCAPQSQLLSCADTIVNFTGAYDAPGVYLDGTPRDHWLYSMVGRAPTYDGTTTINSPIIPVTVNLLNADGTPRSVVTNTTNCPKCKPNQLGVTVPLISLPNAFVQPFVNGPNYASATYTSSPVSTQIADAELRAGFGNKSAENWHNLLNPDLENGVTMAFLGGTYRFSLNNDGSCCAFILVDAEVFQDELYPPTSPPDNSTVIGAAEVSGAITTKDISTFFFPNVFLYESTVSNCCIIGFHGFDTEPGDSKNGNRARFYVLNYSSWISPGIFATPGQCKKDPDNCFADVTAHSHEMAETYNDPFVGYDNIHNITPFWFSGGPFGAQCQDLLEVGDVVEVLNNPTYPVTINNITYHPQTVALLPWFEFESPSTAINGAYSYPNETTVPTLSPTEGLNCAP